MDVTPPGAAGTASRPSRNTPSGIPLVLRRLAIGLAGAALAVLAGVACALSFDDLRALAVSGRAEPRLAYLYPTAFDVLLVVALGSVPLLRGARFLVRLQAGFVLLLLLVAAAAANAATAVGVSFDPDASALVVALLPWVMLAIGLWLLLLLLKHMRTNRADLDGDNDSDDDLVPFDAERERRAVVTGPYPVAERDRPAPAHVVAEEHGAPPLQPVPEAVAPPGYVPPLPVSPVSETVAPPEYAPPLPATPPQAENEPGSHTHTPGIPGTPDTDEDGLRLPPEALSGTAAEDGAATPQDQVPDQEPDRAPDEVPDHTPDHIPDQEPDQEPGEPEALPVVPPTAAPRTPPVTEPAEPAPAPPMTQPAVTEPAVDEHARDAESAAESAAVSAAPAPEAEADDRPAPPRRNRPVRWGDLVRPHTGDVLVHPRPKPGEPSDAEPEQPEDEAGVDTQPLRQIRDVPDPAHASDSADPDEQHARRGPYAAEGGDQGTPEPEEAEEAAEGTQTGTQTGTVPMAPPSGRMRSTPRPPA
ncbi:DUF2637 domain-containing protein [Microbispora sp. NPDC088329]|uniref:DUF2637 domain-containing protein n=1 Tax=Microbispora sp. NPDC088329 TaxID=3154869 RepID=UPI00343E85AB